MDAPRTPLPPIVDGEEWDRRRAVLLAREKAHTREGDAIAAERRRLPMTEIDPVTLIGPSGETSLLDVFDGRDELVVYKHMWFDGQPFEGQCEGCTISIWDFQDAVYLREAGVSFAVFTEGPYEEIAPFREFMGYTHPWYSTRGIADPAIAGGGGISSYLRVGERVFLTYETYGRGVETIMSSLHLLDLTPYGRRETWEDSPEGWPQVAPYSFWRRDGRPTSQWTRPGVTPVHSHEHAHVHQ